MGGVEPPRPSLIWLFHLWDEIKPQFFFPLCHVSRGSSLAKNFDSMIRRKSWSVPPLGNIKLLFGQGSCPAKLRLFDSVVSEVVPIPPPGNVQFLESQVA